MPTSKPSARSSTRSKKNPSTTTRRGREIIAALQEVHAHVRGKKSLPVSLWPDIDTARIRRGLKMPQQRFADTFGLDVTAVRAWEQKRRQPDRAARILMAVIAAHPDVVMDVVKRTS